MTDAQVALANCQAAQAKGKEIDDATARTIASWHYDGQASDGYAFVSTGAIAPGLWRELFLNDDHRVGKGTPGTYYQRLSADDRLMADMLGTYLIAAGPRGPVPGWSSLWVR